MIWRCLLVFVVVAGLAGSPALAQEPPPLDPIESMPIRVGSFGFSPALTIADVGVDDNVFNSETNPQSDFTATIVPRLVMRMRARRLLLTYRGSSDFVYYDDLVDERSVNNASGLRLDLSLGRLQPFIAGGLEDTRARLNAEVDARAPRTNRNGSAGTRVLLASRTMLTLGGRYAETEFDPGILFEGTELARTLNSRQQAVDGALHLLLTPLTTLEIGGSLQRDRFPADPIRDSDGLRLAPVLRFAPDALLKGSAAVGYRRFRTLSDALPDYSGLYVATTLSYTLLGRTKFDWQVSRDVQYSFDDTSPYYLDTGTRLTVTQQVSGRFDVQAIGGRQRLDYRTGVTMDTTRVDHADVLGAGIGFRVGENLRLGLNGEYARRQSERVTREYERRRVFASLNYGS